MKRNTNTALALLALVFLMPGVLLAAGSLGISGGHDLDDLWSKVQANYDLEKEDAVILLESQKVSFTGDGGIATSIHRVVWIGTAVGIRSYADLRIPWNNATSKLEVEILRTWREGQWWPDAEKISDTAVVHTLPHALDKAADYTTMRETMLLHDGVELGCIMETAYTITENDVPARGGIFVIPQQDPSVLTELLVEAPSGTVIKHESLNSAAAPVSGDDGQLRSLKWTAHKTSSLNKPATSSPEAYEPAVVWSTWENWDTLAKHWNAAVNDATELASIQVGPFMSTLEPTLSPWQTIAAVGDYLNEMVRRVRYNDKMWQFAPRQSAQTLSTAYGHDLDRAVLAIALLKEAGFNAEAQFVGNGVFLAAPDIPRLQDMDRLVIRVPDVMDAYLNPATGKAVGMDEAYGHPFYYISSQYSNGPHPRHLPQPDKSLKIAMSLEPESDGSFVGSGYFRGSTALSPFSPMVAGDDLRTGYSTKLVASVLPGTGVTGATPIRIETDWVEVSFALKIDALEGESTETTKLQIGSPASGLAAKIPGNVHLYEATRSTPVMGLEGITQEVIVRVKVESKKVLHRPEPKSIQNKAGSFELKVLEEDGWLTLIRTVSISPSSPIPATDWPDLRELLIEESDPINGSIWLE